MFCSQCGHAIREGDAFCTRCGNRVALAPPTIHNPVYQPPSPIPAQPAQTFAYAPAPAPRLAEKIVWIFRADRKFSIFKMTPCYIVFMEDKAVLAFITPELQKREGDRVSREIKEANTGFFKGSAAMMKFWSDYYKKYYTMSSAAILAEDPTNVILPYHQISEVYFKGFYESVSSGDSSSTVTQGKFEIETANGENYKFTHSQTADRSIQETLTRLFGSRLKYKK